MSICSKSIWASSKSSLKFAWWTSQFMLQSTIFSWKIALAETFIVVLDDQKQPSELFYKKIVLKDFHKFHRKKLCYSLQAYNFIKKRLQNRCFPVKFTISFFLNISFEEHLRAKKHQLLLENAYNNIHASLDTSS